MSLSQAAWKAEQAIGHNDNAITAQDVTNPGLNREKWGDPTETMKALCWMGKNNVQMGTCLSTPTSSSPPNPPILIHSNSRHPKTEDH